MSRVLLVLFQVLVLALPARAQDSDSAFIQRQIEQVESEIASDLRQVDTVRKQAQQYRDLAASAEQNAAESAQPQDKQSWLDSAKQRRDRAEQLEQDAQKLQERVAEKQAKIDQLKQQFDERREASERREATDRKFQDQQKKKAAEAAAATPVRRPPVEEILGLWRDENDEPLAIVQQDPGNAAYPHRLEAHSVQRKWTGHYHSEGSGEPMVTLSYKPTAEEINPEVPEWARKKTAGQLEWKLEIEPGGTCGTPSLTATFYPGEVKWREDGEGAENGAWIAGKGKPREIPLTASQPDMAFYSYGSPTLYLRPPGEFDRNFDTIDGLIEAQLFHVEVILPPELAEDEGETLDVTVKGLSGAGTDTFELRRGAVRVGRSVVYAHYDPVAIAVPTDPGVRDLRPAFLSVDYFLNLTGNRLDLKPSNAEMIEFSYAKAVQTVPIYRSWVQRGIARHQEAVQRLRPFFAAVVADPSSTREQKEAATKRLNMIRNYERIFESEKIHDYVRYQLGEHYLRPFGGLVSMSDGAIAANAELAHTWISAGNLYSPLTDKERDGRNNPSGRYENVAWTSRYEMATTQQIVANARKDYQDVAVSELSKAVLFAMYSGVASASGAGDAVTLFGGMDIFGKPVAPWQRVMAAIGMVSSNLLQVTLPRVANSSSLEIVLTPGNTGGRTLRPGPRAKLREVKIEQPGAAPKSADGALARMSPAQRATVVKSAEAGEATVSKQPVKCALAQRNPRAPAAEPPGPVPGPPPRPAPLDADFSRVKTFYGQSAEVVNPAGDPLMPPQNFGTCQCSSTMLRVKEATGVAYPEVAVVGMLARKGAVKPGTNEPLTNGYTDEQLVSFLEEVGAEFMTVPAKQRPTLEQLSSFMRNGWFVRDVVKTRHSGEPHAIELRQLHRDAKGEITHAEWFDPAFGKMIKADACDYVNNLVARDYDTIFYRWREGDAPRGGADTRVAPRESGSQSSATPENTPAPRNDPGSPTSVGPRETGPQTAASRPGNTPASSRDADQQSVAGDPAPNRPNPGAAAGGNRPKTTRELMNEVIDEMYPDGSAPPINVTNQEILQTMQANGIWEQPAGGGASFSPPGVGTLRMGDVAIRIKPGMESYIEWRQHPSGRVPMFWRSGKVGVGESRTYIPTEFLQWLNPRARAWRDFEGKGK